MASKSNINISFAAEDLHSLDAALQSAGAASTNPAYTGTSSTSSSPFVIQQPAVSMALSPFLEQNFKNLSVYKKRNI